MNEIKILLADDDQDILRVMSRKISQEGYSVIEASDGQMAWEKIQQEKPDIIILDLTMPHKDGLEVLKDLQAHPPSEMIPPVIIVSARGELEDYKKGYELDADHYLTKPCNIKDILHAIKLMIQLIPGRKNISDDK